MIPEYLEVEPEPAAGNTAQTPSAAANVVVANQPKRSPLSVRDWLLIGAAIIVTAGVIGGLLLKHNLSRRQSLQANQQANIAAQAVNLANLGTSPLKTSATTNQVTINGQLQTNNGLIVQPSGAPANAAAGQIYFDSTTNQLAYFNGTNFVPLTAATTPPAGVSSLGGLQGSIGLGSGLLASGGNLLNSGVTSLQGQTGAVSLVAGNGIGINGTTISNTGILSVVAGDSTVSVSNDGAGNVTITASGTGGDITAVNAGDGLSGGATSGSATLAVDGTVARLNGVGDGQTFTGTNQLFQNSVDSTTGFQIQNAAGNSNLLVADTANTRIGIGINPSYTLDVNGDINIAGSNALRIGGTVICTASGCTGGSGGGSFINNSNAVQPSANFAIQSANAAYVGGLIRGAVSQTADLLELQNSGGNNLFKVGASGATTLQNSSDSTAAFRVLNNAGTSVAAVDTTNGRLGLGTATSLTGGAQFFNASGSGSVILQAASPGSSTFTLTLPAETGTICSTASICAGYGAATGNGNYIQNNTSLQSAANFNISGSGSAQTSFLTPLLDTPSGTTTLNIGTTNATAGINLNQNVTLASGKTLTVQGTALVKPAVNSTTAFQVQNTSSNSVVAIDTTNGRLILGGTSGITGAVQFFNTAGSGSVLMQAANPGSSSFTLTVPGETGTLCTTAGSAACLVVYAPGTGSGNYIQNTTSLQSGANFNISGTGTAQTSFLTPLLDTPSGTTTLNIGTTNATAGINLNQNVTLASGKTLTVQGTALFKPASNSVTAFQIQPSASGTSVLDVDTTNGRVGINTNAPSGDLSFGNGADRTLNVVTAASGNGNNLTITAGNGAASGATNGGNLVLTPGAKNSSGSSGSVIVKPQSSNDSGTTFQIQNAAGVQVLTAGTLPSSNLVTNGNFELNTTGWAAKGSATLSQTSAQKYFGASSLQIVTSAVANAGAQYASSFTNGTQYSFTIYVRGATSFSSLQIGHVDSGSDVLCMFGLAGGQTNVNVSANGWSHYSCTFTAATTTAIFVKQNDATARTFYLDDVSMQASGTGTHDAVDGSINFNAVITSPLLVQPLEDSTTTMHVMASNGYNILNVDSLNQQVAVNSSVGTALFASNSACNSAICAAIYGITTNSSSFGVNGTGFGGGGVYGLGSNTAGIFGQGAGVISGLFQTSNSDGSNSSSTLVARLNTSQTADLFQAQDTSGNSLLSVGSTGNLTFNTSTTTTTHTISVAQASTNNAGNTLTISAGAGNGTGAGGTLNLQGGAAGTTGGVPGGSVNISGANSNGVSSGGSVTLLSGATGGNGGAQITVSGANLSSGTVTIQGGNTTNIASGFSGGNVTIQGGAGNAGNLSGGSVIINGGLPSGSGSYGNIVIGSFLGVDTGNVGIGAGTINARLHVYSSTSGLALLTVTDATSSAVNVFNIADEGATTFRNRTNSTSGFQIQNAAGTALFNVDTTNSAVQFGSDISLLEGANRTISVANRSTSGAGYNLTVAAGGGNTSGNGGTLNLQGGAAGAAGVGGAVSITAANGGSTSGAGGAISLTAGSTLTTGSVGGAISLTGGTGVGNNTVGGAVSLQGGTNSNAVSSPTSSAGGATITAGAGVNFFSAYSGGTASITGGNGLAGNVGGGNVILQGGNKSGTASDGGVIIQNTSSSYLFVADPTTSNLVLTGGFESYSGLTTGGWSPKTGATVTGSTSFQHEGNRAIQITTSTSAGSGITYTSGSSFLSSSTQYTLSFWARLSSGSMTTLEYGRADNGSTDSSCATGQTLNTTWTLFTCTFTTGTVSGTPYIYLKQTDTTSRAIVLDAVQLELGSSASTFNPGGQLQLLGTINSPLTIRPKTDSSQVLQVQNSSGTNLFNIDTTGNGLINVGTDVTFAQGADRTLKVADRSTSGAGYALNVTAGSANTNGIGGTLNLTGGVGVSLNGGAVNITGGFGSTGGDVLLTGGGSTGDIPGFIRIQGASTSGGSVSIEAGAGFGSNGSINIGTTQGPQGINIGGGGAGPISLQSSGNINLGTTNGNVVLGRTGSATVTVQGGSGINIGTGGVANTIQIGNTSGAVTQTINIGNNSTASSNNNVTIGSTVSGTVALQGPATITNRNSGSADSLSVSNSTSTGNIAIFKDNSTAVATIANGGATTFENSTDSSAAFQVQNSSGTNLLNIDTTGNGLINVGTDITFAQGADRTLKVADRTTSGAGYNLSVTAGKSNGVSAGGTLNLTGGANGSTSGLGGDVAITGGAAGSISGDGGSISINGGQAASGFNGSINIGTTRAGNVNVQADASINIGTTSGTTTIGRTSASLVSIQAGTTINLGSAGAANTIQVGNTSGAVTQTINIGNNSTASSTNNVTIGSTIAGTVALQGPSTITNRTSGSTDTLAVSNSTSTGNIAVFKDNSTTVATIADGGETTFKNSTDSTTAFQVQTTGSVALLNVNTTNARVEVTDLKISSSITVNGHIISGNSSGTTTITAGAAACTSPTVSVSGNDTAGTISVTTGTGCAGTGLLATISFANSFASAPRVILTPAGTNAAALQYYTNTSGTTSFTLDTNTTPTDATLYKYNYFVIQ